MPSEQAQLSTMEVLIFLKKVALFGDFELEELLNLVAITSEIVVPAGETIIAEGESGSSAYVIVSGMVEVYRQTGHGDVILATLDQSQYFGEMAIIENEPRSASVRARSDCRLLRLDGRQFRRMMESNAVLSFRLVQVFSRRLRRMSQAA
ncbi:MAG: cyclic nucleotide-binding domain-containing protein [Spirochaetes bacterium]|nr:cyclic nucleotide-binding domain-containing protein [Spirochaetota bacterium]